MDAWTLLPLGGDSLQLAPTLLSGMSFRWWRTSAANYVGVLGAFIFELHQDEITGEVFYRSRSQETSSDAAASATSLLLAHLRLDNENDRCFNACTHEAWQADPSNCAAQQSPALRRFRRCAAALPGVRVVKILDPWETLVTFMGSANNNIKRNMQMVRNLAAAFPHNRIGSGWHDKEEEGEEEREDSTTGCTATDESFFVFPSVEDVLTLSEERLWELGWGYRAPRLYKLCREVHYLGGEGWLHALAHESEPVARKALMQLTGVGRKVADCCLLFGYSHDGCVPVDTHCLQLAQRLMLPGHQKGRTLSPPLYTEIVSRFHEEFGPERAGHAFMQMFVAELSDFRRRAADDERADERAGVAAAAATAATAAATAATAAVAMPDACATPRPRARRPAAKASPRSNPKVTPAQLGETPRAEETNTPSSGRRVRPREQPPAHCPTPEGGKRPRRQSTRVAATTRANMEGVATRS